VTHPFQKRRAAANGSRQYPVTPDGRYFVVRGKLWRMANPDLASVKRQALVAELMKARGAVRAARLAGDAADEADAHRTVDAVKRELGERGPVWWSDGAPDFNRHAVKNTPYEKWYSGLRASRRRGECT
jgi:hypothetical protein